MKSELQILRWAGSKRRLISTLVRYWNAEQHVRYVEPFAGSASLFFALDPKRALLSDSNEELTNLYVAVRDTPDAVSHELDRLPQSRETYNSLRGQDYSNLTSAQRAARLVYLNRFCFNGLYRTNLQGQFNVPYAPTRTGRLPSFTQIQQCSVRLRSCKIVCGDFERVVRDNVRSGDLVYLDPPYAVENRRIFRQYGPATFGLEDLERLSELLHCINALGATFVLSYADSAESRRQFNGWHVERKFVQRNISGFAKHRRRAAELVFTNSVIAKR